MQTPSDFAKLAERAIARCQKLSSFSEDSGGTRRTFLCPAMRDCHQEIGRWLQPLALEPRIDAVGNLRAIYPGAEGTRSRLLVGSHLDTVPNAGAYDGILGVVLAIALLESLNGRKLPFAIEVVGFSEEEGVRFATPFIGSRALVGRIDDELLARTDGHAISVRKAIQDYGLNPAEIAEAALLDDVFGYLEFHIEQGPVLEQLGRPLAVVEGIAGQSRLELTFVGLANHAGTTPMSLRRDAVAGAAEWITAVERAGKDVDGLVATVGSISVRPGATNVIAGEVRLSLDVRHINDSVRTRAVKELIGRANQIGQRRGLSVRSTLLLDQGAVRMDRHLTDQLEGAIRAAGCEAHRMVSGAGHDAMILAERVPSAMIFLRTPGGISHDPAESVAVEDVEKAIECGSLLLDQLASSKIFQTRMSRA